MLSVKCLCFRIQCRCNGISLFCRSFLDGYLALWEWNLYVVLVECIVDALHDLTIVHILGENIHPYQYLEGDATIVEAFQHYLDTLLVIDAVELVKRVDEYLFYFFYITTISYAHLQNIKLLTMIASHIFVVLREELCVLEGYHRTIGSLEHGGCIADAAYTSACAITDDIVAHLHTSHHQRNTIVDILQDDLGTETKTRRKTCKDG